jgi:PAS domain-containing protein
MSLSLNQSFEKLSNEKSLFEQILASIPIGIITVRNQNGEVELNWKAKELTRLGEVTCGSYYDLFPRIQYPSSV